MLGTNRVYAKRLWSHTLRYFGGKDKAIKSRIATVKTIEKITKSMKMISSIKVRIEQKNLEHGKDFGMDSVENIFKSDLYMQRKMPSEPEKPTQLIVSFTSDKGLCGSVNTSIVRAVTSYIGDDKNRFKMFTIGDRGSIAYSRPFAAISKEAYIGLTTPVSFGVSMAIANKVISMSEGLDSIALFFNKFRNLVSYRTTRVELMSKARFFEWMKFQRLYEMERPDANTAVPALYELYVASHVHNALLNSNASEQSSRMMAMDGANKNCIELSKKLSLLYNKARQSQITTELWEVVAGTQAMEK